MSDMDSYQKEILSGLLSGDTSHVDAQDFWAQYDLGGNPFPPSGIAATDGYNPPLDYAIAKKIINFINNGYYSKQRQFLVIKGDYGTGKTHTLRFIERAVNHYLFKGDHTARAIYVERPRIEAHELNRAILRSVGYDTVRKYTWFAIREILANEIQEPTEQFDGLRNKLTAPKSRTQQKSQSGLFDPRYLATLTPFDKVFNVENIQDYRIFLQSLETNGWNREEVRYYLEYLLHIAVGVDKPALEKAFVALLLAPDEATFTSWENLASISDPKILKSLRAPDFLEFLLKMLEINGIVYVYLLIDEFEEVSQGHLLSAKQRQDYLYTIREVLNRIYNGLSIVIAISPGGWDAISKVATPLADVSGQPLELGPINTDEAIRLVRYYYSTSRRDEKNNSIEPLDHAIIEYILNNFPRGIQLTPRNLIQFLYTLFDYLAEHRVTKLTEILVNQLLAQFGSSKSTRSSRLGGHRD